MPTENGCYVFTSSIDTTDTTGYPFSDLQIYINQDYAPYEQWPNHLVNRADGSARDRVDAALNDMVKAAVTGLAFAPTVPVLESNGNTILGAAVGGIYDMSIAKANSNRKNNTSRTSSSSSPKSGYSGRWLVSVEWKYTGSGKFCWEICTKRYSDG